MAQDSHPTLRFLGAAGTVTGSRYLIQAGERRILIDCGLFQGFKQLRRRNREPFPVRPGLIDTVLLTHAHLDHSGYVPLYLNSPMAVGATDIYHRRHEEHHVSREECLAMFKIAKRVNSAAESKKLNLQRGPMTIVSASGMLTFGRILHHVASFGGDSRNAILLSACRATAPRRSSCLSLPQRG